MVVVGFNSCYAGWRYLECLPLHHQSGGSTVMQTVQGSRNTTCRTDLPKQTLWIKDQTPHIDVHTSFPILRPCTCEHHRRVITTSAASKQHVALAFPSPFTSYLSLQHTHAYTHPTIKTTHKPWQTQQPSTQRNLPRSLTSSPTSKHTARSKTSSNPAPSTNMALPSKTTRPNPPRPSCKPSYPNSSFRCPVCEMCRPSSGKCASRTSSMS